MFWFKIIKSLFSLLQSNISPVEIAGGVALGTIIGLSPFFTLHNLIIFILVILLNVNISSALFAIVIFGILGHFTDPLANLLGKYLLVNLKTLTPFWTNLYNMPIVPFTRFYNTVVLGNIVISLVLLIPVYIFSKKFIVSYRINLAPKVEKLRIMKMFKLSGFYNFYSKFKP